MGATLVLAPVVIASFPVVTAVAASALASLGYAAARGRKKQAEPKGVTLEMEGARAIQEGVREEGQLVFERMDLTLRIEESAGGGYQVRVSGAGRTEEELRKAGQEAIDRITQQYAYHRLVTELKQRRFEVVEEGVQEDRSIRLRVRQWRA